MAKLQDTLEVFMEELEKVQNSIDSVKEIDTIIDSKINEIKKIALKVEISNLESANQLFLKELENQYLKIEKKSKLHLESIENRIITEKNYFNKYYKIGIGFLIVFLLSMTLAVKFHYQSKQLKKSINMKNLKIEFYLILLMRKNSITLLKDGLMKNVKKRNKIWITFYKSYPHFIFQQQFNF